MLPTNILAVASSVSADHNFDTLEAITYAANNDFQGFQAFLNNQILHDPEVRRKVRSICRNDQIRLVAHAPATLNWSTASDNSINSAAKDLYEPGSEIFLVHHFDEMVSREEALKCLWHLHNQKIITCLENFFILGAQTSKKCFENYLELLTRANNSGIDLIPVLDIPRLYDPKVRLTDIAIDLLEEAFNVFKRMKMPLILHLIDGRTTLMARDSWCPIGQGVIPYVDIFDRLMRYNILIYMIIFEFEDKINPIKSKDFLKRYLLDRTA